MKNIVSTRLLFIALFLGGKVITNYRGKVALIQFWKRGEYVWLSYKEQKPYDNLLDDTVWYKYCLYEKWDFWKAYNTPMFEGKKGVKDLEK